MNRAFIMIAIPAFVVSFVWLYVGYGLAVAAPVIAVELAGAIGGIVYLRRRKAHVAGR